MKTIKRNIHKMSHYVFAILILMTTILSVGCKKLEDKPDKNYEVRFEINAMSIPNKDNDRNAKSTMSMLSFLEAMSINPLEVTNVRIGIDGSHDFPMISKVLPYSIEDGITGAIKMSVGDHNLVSIELLKEVGEEQYEVLYSGVGMGSPLSNFVSTVLPLTFHIPLLNQTSIKVDVVAIDDWTPEDFGWALFDIGLTTVYPIYFYGADDNGAPSIMSMEVLKNGEVISTGVTNENGLLKVLYPDIYSEYNGNESYTFNLTKDGILYTRIFTVEELLSLPREVNLLNVYGSGMMNFIGWRTIRLTVYEDIGNSICPTSYEVRNSIGEIIWQSDGYINQPTNVMYTDTSEDDYSELITISFTYKNALGQVIMGSKTTTQSVATFKNNPIIDLRVSTNNWWLFI